MTRAEKLLYHQIHPLKPITDFTTAFASTWLLWQAQWATAAIVAFVPSILVSALVLWRADMQRLSCTPMGRYVATFMNRKVEALRFCGQAVVWTGAASHIPWLIPSGFMIIVFAWMGGLLVPDATPKPDVDAGRYA